MQFSPVNQLQSLEIPTSPRCVQFFNQRYRRLFEFPGSYQKWSIVKRFDKPRENGTGLNQHLYLSEVICDLLLSKISRLQLIGRDCAVGHYGQNIFSVFRWTVSATQHPMPSRD